ncbi:MAG: metallophosphatase, partial [Atopobiaceae bacterium]|nr:metallophosphatase [Atopobiaceae bacterium]
MAVFLTGDTHGSIDVGKVKEFARVAEGRLCRDDYLIILGDFGVIWHDPPSQAETDLLAWYETAPWTT